jgi:AcrR family transcriptional regulator
VEAILTATARILVKDGFEHASTNRIAQAAGVSIGSLYQYFPSKEALVAALVERHIGETMDMVRAAFARLIDAPVQEAAREIIRIMIRVHQHDPKLHRALFQHVPQTSWIERLADIDEQVIALVTAYLDLHQAELRPRNRRLAAFIASKSVEALTHAAVLFQPEYLDEQEFVDEMAELLVRYLSV